MFLANALAQRDETLALELLEEHIGRILAHLVKRGAIVPVPLLRRRPKAKRIRLTAKERYARRLPKGRRAKAPGELVQIDTLFVNIRPGKAIKHFTAYDPIAKWTIGRVSTEASAASAKSLLDKVLIEAPFPVRGIQVDGGSEFKSVFEQECEKRGLELFFLPPKRPDLNGCVERAQSTWRYEFYAAYDLPHRIDKLQPFVDAFAHRFNHHRPHEALGGQTPAEYLQATVKAFLNWAVAEDLISVSPANGVRAPAHETPRERTLTDDELGAVLRACAGLGAYGQGVKLLALTGQRRSEIFEATWNEFDLEAKVWTLPAARCKNNRAHSVPLSPQALEVLAWAAPAFQARGHVFEPQSFSKMKTDLDKLLPPMPKWTLHDLRRTAASGMAALGARIETVEKVLNHTSGSFRGIVGCYQRYDFAGEKKAALDLWGAHVASLLAEPTLVLAAA